MESVRNETISVKLSGLSRQIQDLISRLPSTPAEDVVVLYPRRAPNASFNFGIKKARVVPIDIGLAEYEAFNVGMRVLINDDSGSADRIVFLLRSDEWPPKNDLAPHLWVSQAAEIFAANQRLGALTCSCGLSLKTNSINTNHNEKTNGPLGPFRE